VYFIFVLILTVEAAFLACELAARFYALHYVNPSMIPFLCPPDLIAQKERRGEMGMIGSIGYREDLCPGYRTGANRHNSLGFRGDEIAMPKPQGEFRIACLGGSTTYDTSITPWDKTYPAVLESILRHKGYRVTVINAGTPGFTTRDCLLKFETVVAHLGVDMIVQCEAVNDVLVRSVWPPECYRSDYAPPGVLSFNYSYVDSIADYSLVLHVLRAVLDSSVNLGTKGYFHGMKGNLLASDAFNQLSAGVYPEGILKTVGLRDAFAKNSPAPFEMNLRNIVTVAMARNITPMLMTFALSREQTPKDAAGKDVYGAIADGVDEMNGIIRSVAGQSGVLFYDLAQSLSEDDKHGSYFTDFCHNNEAGAQLKAEHVADFIISRKEHDLPKL
jgi:lysophospholipase L1-like esterase